MRVAGIVPAAGRGQRLGGEIPKALVLLEGRTLLAHALAALAASDRIDCVLPVLPRDVAPPADIAGIPKLLPAVIGGARRQDSVAAGLAALPSDCDWVAVHDAARAMVLPAAVSAVVDAARQHGAAILALPLRDTLKRVREGAVVDTAPRAQFWAAQTPQVFRVDVLREALEKARTDGRTATDCSQLVEAIGVPVRVVLGHAENWKITYPEDLAAAAQVLAGRRR